jgi:hypothetical protein
LALLFGKIQTPKELQHACVLTHYQRVKVSNPIIPRYVDQQAAQGYPYPTALSAIFYDGRVLGMLFTRFAIVTHDGDDLALVVQV